MKFFHFLMLSLACYRLTVLIARDAGPFGVFKRLRAWKWMHVLSCPYCVSVWIGALLVLLFHFTYARQPALLLACESFALSAVTIMCDRIFTSDHQT